MKRIAEWHERILTDALKWRQDHPEFRFNLRTGDVRDEDRLGQGYWFTGNDRYLFFAPFAPNEPNNKTRSIGFVIEFNAAGEPKASKLEVVFGAVDAELKPLHQKIADQVGLDRMGTREKYRRYYPPNDPITAFHQFLADDYPKIRATIDESGKADAMIISDEKFNETLNKTLSLRAQRGSATGAAKTKNSAVPSEAATRPINRILYGPPGTGKTYWMQQEFKKYTDNAVAEDAWLREVMSRVGWRPVIAAALSDIAAPATVPDLKQHKWIRAKAAERGRSIGSVSQSLWGYLMEHTPESVTTVRAAIRREPFIFSKTEDSRWELVPEWKDIDDESMALLKELTAGPKPASAPLKRYRMVTFHPSYSYEDFVRGIRPVTTSETEATQFRLVAGVFKRICDDARQNPAARYALFIDEINRANIAKVFGELITLIEPDKRAAFDNTGRLLRGVTVHLPGGDGDQPGEDEFGVPVNLDIFGTMNTADRSIALLDIALRRRFEFVEMEPQYELLSTQIDGVNLANLLRAINDRLEYLVDRDHRIGHAYFMKVETIDALRSVFKNQIIPLLQEYFFDDFSKVAKVLSSGGTKCPFVSRRPLNHEALFKSVDTEGEGDRFSFRITDSSSWTSQDFVAVYSKSAENPELPEPSSE